MYINVYVTIPYLSQHRKICDLHLDSEHAGQQDAVTGNNNNDINKCSPLSDSIITLNDPDTVAVCSS